MKGGKKGGMRCLYSGESERKHQRKGCVGSFHGECISRDHWSEPDSVFSLNQHGGVEALLSFITPTNIPLMSFLCLVLMPFDINSWITLHCTEFDVKSIANVLPYYYHQNMFNELCITGDWFKHGSKFSWSDRDQRHCGASIIYNQTNCRWKNADHFAPEGLNLAWPQRFGMVWALDSLYSPRLESN